MGSVPEADPADLNGASLANSTFSLVGEDHTLGNAARYVLNQDPRVSFCGYSVPHPSEVRVNVRVQTTGESARVVFREALQDLSSMCNHIELTFETAVKDFKSKDGMDVD